MPNIELGLSKRLDYERKVKLQELGDVNLEKILSLNIIYSEVYGKPANEIVKICLDRYLAKFERTSLVIELGKLSKSVNEAARNKVLELFCLVEFDISDEKSGAINRLNSAFFNEFCDPKTGLIDWVKLIQFNSGNYEPQDEEKQR